MWLMDDLTRDELHRIRERVRRLEERMGSMATQQDVDAITSELADVESQLTSAQSTLQSELDSLQAKIDQGATGADLDLSGLKAAADALSPAVAQVSGLQPTVQSTVTPAGAGGTTAAPAGGTDTGTAPAPTAGTTSPNPTEQSLYTFDGDPSTVDSSQWTLTDLVTEDTPPRPLYTFAGDTAPGETNGDGVGGVWHLYSGATQSVPSGAGGTVTDTVTTGAAPAGQASAAEVEAAVEAQNELAGGGSTSWPAAISEETPASPEAQPGEPRPDLGGADPGLRG